MQHAPATLAGRQAELTCNQDYDCEADQQLLQADLVKQFDV